MIVIPVRCLRCGGWTLRSPRQLRTPRRHAPRWMRNAPALVMAGGIQIGASGVTIGSGGVIVTDADGTPCCCVSSASSSSRSGSVSSQAASSSSASAANGCPNCDTCPGTLSLVVSLPGNCTATYSLHYEGTGSCSWRGTNTDPTSCAGTWTVSCAFFLGLNAFYWTVGSTNTSFTGSYSQLAYGECPSLSGTTAGGTFHFNVSVS
jgi:hypothetical protein